MDNLHDLDQQQRALSLRVRDIGRDASEKILDAEMVEATAFSRLSAELEEIDRRAAEEDDRHTSAMGDLMRERDQALRRYDVARADAGTRRTGVAASLTPPAGNTITLLKGTGNDG